MSVVLQELQSIIGGPLSVHHDGSPPTWLFSKRLANQPDEFFHSLVRDHPLLDLRYNVLCARLAHAFARKESKPELFSQIETVDLIKQLMDALAMAELLTYIYYFYLNVPREVIRLQKEQEVYRSLLRMQGYKFPTSSNFDVEPPSFFFETEKVRDYTRMLNWPRLFAVRIRRVLTTLVPIIEQLKAYAKGIAYLDRFFGPALNYVAWLFYIPRLAVNVFSLIKHLVPGSWMHPKEEKLDWLIRLEAQLQRRWFELLNDSVWMVAGILGCFLLVGALAAPGMYLTISLFFFDVVMASVRAYIELGRLNKLRTEYNQIVLTLGAGDYEIDKEIADYQAHLDRRFIYERRRLLLSVASTSALFLVMCFALPMLASVPFVPLISAALVLSITLITYLIDKWIEKQKPVAKEISKESKLRFAQSPYGFFRTSNTPDNPELSDANRHRSSSIGHQYLNLTPRACQTLMSLTP